MEAKRYFFFIWYCARTQELCESRGGRLGLPVPNRLDGVCGRKATLNFKYKY